MNMIETLARELGLRENNIRNAVELLDAGKTVPFIARYRTEATGSMDDQQLRALADYYFSPLWLADYAADEAGLLPPELKRGVLAEDTLYNLLTDDQDAE